MSQGPSNRKREMFQKIRSNFERKQLFEQLIAEKGELTCKGDSDSLFRFRAVEIKGLEGVFVEKSEVEGKVPISGNIVANFRVGEDRFFMQTSFLVAGHRELMLIPAEVYKLQRRAHNRVDLDPRIERKVIIIEHNHKSAFCDVDCLDLSAGGARIVIHGDLIQVSQGDNLRMSFQIKNKWSFEVSGVVRHLVKQEDAQVFGFEFDTANKGLINKLTMMMLELQRWVVLNVNKP